MSNTRPSLRVEILSNKLIKPSSPTPDHLRVLKLSFLDQLSHRYYAPIPYFYPAAGTVDAAGIARRLKQLEKSLSDILVLYYPLAGRLSDDVQSVDCRDQGGAFRVSKVLNIQLSELLELAHEDLEILHCLIPERRHNIDLVTAPLVRVQINIFECGGLAVAVEILHTMADGFSGTMFAAEWAKLNRSLNIEGELHLPSFELGSIFPAFEVSTKLKPNPPLRPGTKLVDKILTFDAAGISILKNQVMESAPALKQRPPSRVEVVTAFVWNRLIRAAQARNGRLRASMTSLSINLRGRTSTGIPDNCFGNLYVPVPIVFLPDETKMELHHFVVLIRDAVQKTVSACAKASKDDLSSLIIRAHNEMREWASKEEIDSRLASTLCRFPLYETDFGWGKPTWIGMMKLSSNMFMLLDTKCATGIEAFLCLNDIEMQKLEQDPYMAPFISRK